MRATLTILGIVYWAICFGQNSKEELFVKTVKQVIEGLAKRDSIKISRFTDKKAGVYILNAVGTKQTYTHFKTMGFSDAAYPNAPFYDKARFTTIKYEKQPVYICAPERWSKWGLYVDTIRIDHLLTKIAVSRNKNFQDHIPIETIKKFTALENNSRRIVVASHGSQLVFYLSYIDDKWVLTIIDKITCDCSV